MSLKTDKFGLSIIDEELSQIALAFEFSADWLRSWLKVLTATCVKLHGARRSWCLELRDRILQNVSFGASIISSCELAAWYSAILTVYTSAAILHTAVTSVY
jgi:hypothetical protein